MKKNTIKVLMTNLILMSNIALSQPSSPPPPPGGGHDQSAHQSPGGSAPIGSGLSILLGMAMAYAGKKVWKIRQFKY